MSCRSRSRMAWDLDIATPVQYFEMRLRQLNVGCFGGGTGLPSLLGGLKSNPWLNVNAVVTMFDSGGSSGQLRDELGVLPPGDIPKCPLALSRNAREARRVLLARLPTLEHARLGGHTGGNLLLSMMQRYSGDFLNAVDGLRSLLGCRGRVWPVSVEQASVCAEYGDGSETRGEVEVDAGPMSGGLVRRIWLEPPESIHPSVATAARVRGVECALGSASGGLTVRLKPDTTYAGLFFSLRSRRSLRGTSCACLSLGVLCILCVRCVHSFGLQVRRSFNDRGQHRAGF